MPHFRSDLVRYFSVSTIVTIIVFAAVIGLLGAQGLLLVITLFVIELTFSFDNAIVNARVLATMSPLWRRLFLTVGIVIAVVGMRLVFPALLIVVTSGLGFGQTVDLALNHPQEYAHRIEAAEPSIAAFGGIFLLLLALEFFVLDQERPLWIKRIERPLRRLKRRPIVGGVAIAVLLGLTLLPINHHPLQTLVSGLVAIALYYGIHAATGLLPKLLPGGKKTNNGHLVGVAALSSFIYLELLDASFSLDGVLGAFAVTNNILLIVAGLGVGAIWVRSLTVYLVERDTLNELAYIEHGAHYAVLLLAISLLAEPFIAIPSWVVGLLGLAVIGLSLYASLSGRKITSTR